MTGFADEDEQRMGSSWVSWSKGGQPALWLKEKEQKMENQDRGSQGDIACGNMALSGRDKMMKMA